MKVSEMGLMTVLCVTLIGLGSKGAAAFTMVHPSPAGISHLGSRRRSELLLPRLLALRHARGGGLVQRAGAEAVRLRCSAEESGGDGAAPTEGERVALPPTKAGDWGAAHFINLSNGAESLPLLKDLDVPYSFTRIQSSHCESQNFDGILSNLGASLLMHLALGTTCYVHDYGSRNKKRKAPRAVWYGVAFTRYALHKMWELEGEPAKPILRGHNVASEFDRAIMHLDKGVKKQVKYYKNYLRSQSQDIRLYGVVGSTEIDGRRDLHAKLVHEHSSLGGLTVGASEADGALARMVESGLLIFDTEKGFELEAPPPPPPAAAADITTTAADATSRDPAAAEAADDDDSIGVGVGGNDGDIARAARYMGVMLQKECGKRLAEAVIGCLPQGSIRDAAMGTPKREQYHVTLWHGKSHGPLTPNLESLQGTKCTVQPIYVAWDSTCVCCAVRLGEPLGASSLNEVAHVTVWTADGTPNKYSNELLESVQKDQLPGGQGAAGWLNVEGDGPVPECEGTVSLVW